MIPHSRINGLYQYRLTGDDFHTDWQSSRRTCLRSRSRGTLLLCGALAVLCTLWLLS